MLALSTALTAPLVLGMLGEMTGLSPAIPGWVQLALATPVQVWIGWRFYAGTWSSLRGGIGNMDVLVALGTSAAWGVSTWSLLRGHGGHGGLYFEGAAVVIT